MKNGFIIIFLLLNLVTETKSGQDINLLCFENGASIIQYSSSDWGNFKTYFNIDDDLGTSIYCSRKKAPFPHFFIYELVLTAEISTFEFDTQVEEIAFPGASAREIKIYARLRKNEEFEFIHSFFLAQNEGGQKFEVPVFQARWLKIEIVSNYGEPDYSQLARVKAFGNFIQPSTNDSVTGTWITTFGELKITRTKPFITGCYDYGTFHGIFEKRILSFFWTDERQQAGIVTAILNEDGDRLLGFWGDEEYNYQLWTGELSTRRISICPENPLALQLDAAGHTLIFNTKAPSTTDTTGLSSHAILHGAIQFLTENPDKNLAIESYTEPDSNASAAKALAELWALRVKNYFIAQGIAGHRLTINGISEARPLADNETLTGRRLNQRIRLRVQ